MSNRVPSPQSQVPSPLPPPSFPKGSQECGRRTTRRELLQQAGMGLGSVALSLMLAEERKLLGQDGPVSLKRGRARSVILLWMGGGPSHMDTFDPQPDLARLR